MTSSSFLWHFKYRFYTVSDIRISNPIFFRWVTILIIIFKNLLAYALLTTFATIATVLTADTDVNETPLDDVVPGAPLTMIACGAGPGAIFFGVVLVPIFVGLFIMGIGTLVVFCFAGDVVITMPFCIIPCWGITPCWDIGTNLMGDPGDSNCLPPAAWAAPVVILVTVAVVRPAILDMVCFIVGFRVMITLVTTWPEVDDGMLRFTMFWIVFPTGEPGGSVITCVGFPLDETLTSVGKLVTVLSLVVAVITAVVDFEALEGEGVLVSLLDLAMRLSSSAWITATGSVLPLLADSSLALAVLLLVLDPEDAMIGVCVLYHSVGSKRWHRLVVSS